LSTLQTKPQGEYSMAKSDKSTDPTNGAIAGSQTDEAGIGLVEGDAENVQDNSLEETQTDQESSTEDSKEPLAGNGSRFSMTAKVGAAAVGLLALTSGTFLASCGGGSPTNPVAGAQTPTTTEAYNPATDATTGNIRITSIAAGTPTMHATRPNGETITIPVLSKGDYETEAGRVAYTNTVFAEMSGYFSTGDQNILNALTSDTQLQTILKASKDQDFGHTHTATDKENWQAVIFDNPSNPAKYTTGIDNLGKYILMTSGEVYLNYGSDTLYGSPKLHDANPTLAYNYRFSDFKIYPDPTTGKIHFMIWKTNNK
jgi:hypothetical protein